MKNLSCPKKWPISQELPGVKKDVVVITADGRRTPISTLQVKWQVGPLNRAAQNDVSDVLVMDNLQSIGPNVPCAENLSRHEYLSDLVEHFPSLADDRMQFIINTKKTFLTTTILGEIVRFCFLASKMQPPCGENAKCDIFITAKPISKILFLLF